MEALCLLLLCAAASANTNRLQLQVFNLRAEDLPGEFLGLAHADAYVKVFNDNELVGETSTRKDDNDPWWKEEFTYSALEFTILRLEVHDKDFFKDDLIGICQTQIKNTTAQIKRATQKEKCDLKKGGTLYYEYTLE